MKFTEAKLEKAFAELLGQEGFPRHSGITITRKPDEVFYHPVSIRDTLLPKLIWRHLRAINLVN